MNEKIVIIRCQANKTIGFGHLVRSRVLGKKLLELGYKTILVGPSKKYMHTDDKVIFYKWIEREIWLNSFAEAEFHIGLAKTYGVKHIIMDDYRSDYEHQVLLRKARLRILQQYDASKPQRFAADLVINSSPYEKREFYKDSLYDDSIRMLHGPKYSILRSEFLAYDIKKMKKKNNILLTFGGGDDRGSILFVLNELRDNIPNGWKITIVVGEHNPQIKSIKNWLKDYALNDIELLVNPVDIVEVFASAKIAILSGGTTTFEVAFFGVVSILIPIAENQYNQGKGWQNLGASIYLGPFDLIEDGVILNTLKNLVEDEEKLEKMSAIAKKTVDALGAKRVVDILINEV